MSAIKDNYTMFLGTIQTSDGSAIKQYTKNCRLYPGNMARVHQKNQVFWVFVLEVNDTDIFGATLPNGMPELSSDNLMGSTPIRLESESIDLYEDTWRIDECELAIFYVPENIEFSVNIKADMREDIWSVCQIDSKSKSRIFEGHPPRAAEQYCLDKIGDAMFFFNNYLLLRRFLPRYIDATNKH